MFINVTLNRLQCASAAWVTIHRLGTASNKYSSKLYKLHLNDTKWVIKMLVESLDFSESRAFCCNVHRFKADHNKNTLSNSNKQWGVGKLIGTFTSWASRLLGPEATITLSCLVARRDNLESMRVCACVFKWWRPQVLTQLTVQCKEGTGR